MKHPLYLDMMKNHRQRVMISRNLYQNHQQEAHDEEEWANHFVHGDETHPNYVNHY
jgi:hypothetical protein